MLKTSHNKIILLAIFIIGILAYSNTLNSAFQFDDIRVILHDHYIKNPTFLKSKAFWTNIHLRPVALYSFSINHQLGGESPFGYHIFNIIIHLLAGGTVYLLTRLIIQKIFNTQSLIIPLTTTLIFLLHPIQTQSVTYIVQRMTSMSGLFYIVSIYFYIKARLSFLQDNSIPKTSLFFLLTGLSAIVALFTKQTAASLPFMLFATELILIRTKEKKLAKQMITLQFFLLIGAFLYIFIFASIPQENNFISPSTYFITQQSVFFKYLGLLLLPINQNIDHYHQFSETLWATKNIISVSCMGALLVSIVFFIKRNKIIAFGILFILISLSVESTFLPIRDAMVEHRLYLATIGFGIIIGKLIEMYLRKHHFALLLSLSIVLGVSSFSRNFVWESQETLWVDSTEKNPDNYRAWNNLGYALLKQERYEEAISCYKKSLYLNGSNMYALSNLAFIYIKQGKLDKAEAYTKKLIHLAPNSADAYYTYSQIYKARKQYIRAKINIDKAIKLKKTRYKYRFARAELLFILKKHKAAENEALFALRLRPNQEEAEELLKNTRVAQSLLDKKQRLSPKKIQ